MRSELISKQPSSMISALLSVLSGMDSFKHFIDSLRISHHAHQSLSPLNHLPPFQPPPQQRKKSCCGSCRVSQCVPQCSLFVHTLFASVYCDDLLVCLLLHYQYQIFSGTAVRSHLSPCVMEILWFWICRTSPFVHSRSLLMG